MKPDYEIMLEYVKNALYKSGKDKKEKMYQSFRSRYMHTIRVLKWCERLCVDCDAKINEYVLYVSAIFHDIGYAIAIEDDSHAEASVQLFSEFCKTHNVQYSDEISHNIMLHSNKSLLNDKSTSIELILLMEADLLDETGALSILFDCMSSGERHLDSYNKAYERILNFSCSILDYNPMISKGAIRVWQEKQKLLKEFVTSLSIDLNIEEGD